MTCNDCGREISDCDRYGCREVRGVAWAKPLLPRGRPYDGAVVDRDGKLVIPSPPQHPGNDHGS